MAVTELIFNQYWRNAYDSCSDVLKNGTATLPSYRLQPHLGLTQENS